MTSPEYAIVRQGYGYRLARVCYEDGQMMLAEKVDAENIEIIVNFIQQYHEHYDEFDHKPLREALGCELEHLSTYTLMAIADALKA